MRDISLEPRIPGDLWVGVESNLVGLLARLRRPGWAWDPWKGVLKNDELGLHVTKGYLVAQSIYEEERLHALLVLLELGVGVGTDGRRTAQHLRELMKLIVRRGWTWNAQHQALENAALQLVVRPEALAALGIQDERSLQIALLGYEVGTEQPPGQGLAERDGDPPHQGSITGSA